MGGKSKSSSSNSTSTSTVTTSNDNRIGVADSGMLATDGGSIHNENVSDDVVEIALQEAFGFGEGAFNLVNSAFDAVADLKGAELETMNASKSNFDNLLKAGTAVAAVFLLSKVLK